MAEETPTEWLITLNLEDGDLESTDLLTRQLLSELLEQPDVESAALLPAETPDGTKSVEAVTIGAIALAVLPGFLAKLVEFVQAWALRGQGRTVKFKGMLKGQQVEFEGSSEDFKTLLLNLPEEKKTALPTSKT